MIGKIKRFIKSNAWLFLGLKKALLYFRYLKSIGKKSPYAKLPQYEVTDKYSISAKDYHCWFGYYDKSPINANGKYALFLKVAKNAKEGDEAEVCICDMQTKEKTTIGRTRIWNWQQGAMEQWVDEKTASYNNYDIDKKEYRTVRINIETGDQQLLDQPISTLKISRNIYP